MKDPRSEAQIREHYEVEKELASRLRNAPKEARGTLYRALYDELFRRFRRFSRAQENLTKQLVRRFDQTRWS